MVSNVLFLLASAIFLIAFWLYNKGLILGKVTTAFAAWGVFTLITCVNSLTYLNVTASWITISLFATDFVVCAGTSAIIVIRARGRVTVDKFDRWVALLSMVSIVPWVVFRRAAGGNLLNLIPYSLAWLPLHRNAIQNPGSEPTLPWFLDSIAFVLNIAALAIQHDKHMVDYASPVVCLIQHSLMTILSMRKNHSSLSMATEASQS